MATYNSVALLRQSSEIVDEQTLAERGPEALSVDFQRRPQWWKERSNVRHRRPVDSSEQDSISSFKGSSHYGEREWQHRYFESYIKSNEVTNNSVQCGKSISASGQTEDATARFRNYLTLHSSQVAVQ
jgi:hypothetical protein